MASSDMTALMIQMIKQMQEQQYVAQERMQEVMTSVNDDLWPPYWREELTSPPPAPDLRSTNLLRSRSTSRRFPGNPRTGQRGPRSTGLNYRRSDVPMRLRKPRATKRR